MENNEHQNEGEDEIKLTPLQKTVVCSVCDWAEKPNTSIFFKKNTINCPVCNSHTQLAIGKFEIKETQYLFVTKTEYLRFIRSWS